MIKLDIEFVISEEQAEAFAAELYYSTNLVEDIKQCLARSLKVTKHFNGEVTEFYIPFICYLDCDNTSCCYHQSKYRKCQRR